MKKHQVILGAIVVAAIAALFFWGRKRIHFDFHVFVNQLAQADFRRLAIGLAAIYVGYIIRSVRWAVLLRHTKKLPLFSLIGTQVIGFTAVALIGRVADLVRPYLVSKRVGLPLSSQVAVYVVERLFDAGAMALITSSVILLAPAGALPHPEVLKKAALLGLGLTIAGGLFLIGVRLAGGMVATVAERVVGAVSARLALAVGHKIRTFREGLDTIRSFSDFVVTAVLSVVMWLLIAAAYLETMRGFVASPQLASMTAAKAVLLMVVSGGASIIQLPVLGWFTQIGLVEQAIQRFFGASPEAATGCAAALLVVTFLGIVPVGLIWARFEQVSLKKIAEESEHASEALAHGEPSAQEA